MLKLEPVMSYDKFPDRLADWFDRVNARARDQHVRLQHYIISSGIKEMIEASKIGKKFTKVFASSFAYDANGAAKWPALAINYTTKTQFLFRINKGSLSVYDHELINRFVPHEDRPMPFSNIVFIGDGETDINASSPLALRPQSRATMPICYTSFARSKALAKAHAFFRTACCSGVAPRPTSGAT
jgi:haloacid dehalogenase-like hydrolase